MSWLSLKKSSNRNDSMINPSSEDQQHSDLRRMKLFATGLLAIVSLIFVLSSIWLSQYSWLVWIQAFSEAAMVGALADWFAVTALFRHPLGIPIPHTAIVPAKKAQLGVDLGTFIQKNYLSLKLINERIDGFNPALKAANWLAEQSNAENTAKRLTTSIAGLIDAAADVDLRGLVQHNLEELVVQTKAAPFIGNLLAVLWETDYDRQLPTMGLRFLEGLLKERQTQFTKTLQEDMPWYIPNFMRRKIFAKILVNLNNSISEILSDDNHLFRKTVEVEISKLINSLKTSEDYLQRGEKIKAELMSNQSVKDYLQQLSAELKEKLRSAILRSSAGSSILMTKVLLAFSSQIQENKHLQEKLNSWLKAIVRDFIRSNSGSLISFIADITNSWNTKTVVNKIELQVGRDLQFIRLNGTIVGGLIGLLLQLFLSTLMP